jgi:toxin ParE1/3/4
VNRIEGLGQLLAQHPHLERRREELAAGLRSFPMGRYLVFYRPIEDGIEIVRVLHASRDIDNIF